jgi:transposase
MARALSHDLRKRAFAAINEGLIWHAAAVCFVVSVSSAIRWRQLARKQWHDWFDG